MWIMDYVARNKNKKKKKWRTKNNKKNQFNSLILVYVLRID